MAIHRLHKKDWERTSGKISQIPGPETSKCKWSMQVAGTNDLMDLDGEPTFNSIPEKEEVEEISPTSHMHRKKRAEMNRGRTSLLPGCGRKGISSGLLTVVRRGERGVAVVGQGSPKSKHAWWKLILPAGGAKAPSVRLDR